MALGLSRFCNLLSQLSHLSYIHIQCYMEVTCHLIVSESGWLVWFCIRAWWHCKVPYQSRVSSLWWLLSLSTSASSALNCGPCHFHRKWALVQGESEGISHVRSFTNLSVVVTSSFSELWEIFRGDQTMIDVALVLLVLVGTACPTNPEQREASVCFERKVTTCT